MIKSQIWRPDTCGCEIEQEYDYSTQTPTFVSGKHLKRCDVHPSHKYDDILNENQKKNKVLYEILSNYTEIQKVNDNGSIVFKDGFSPDWSFDIDRNLVINLPSILNNKKAAIQSLLSKFNGVSIK